MNLKLKEIVKNNLGLTQRSFKIFEENYDNPFIDDSLKYLFENSDDLRVRFSIPEEAIEELDYSWILFKKNFKSFMRDYPISYKYFKNNKVKNGKNIEKLMRFLSNYYFDRGEDSDFALIYDFISDEVTDIRGLPSRFLEEAKEIFKREYQNIISNKMGKDERYEFVLSLNFDDWFLSATRENWTSCLNLESNYHGATWTGLPGLIVDKNRIMLYITNGKKKEYQGIKTDFFLFRAWGLLDENNRINVCRWFPRFPFANLEGLSKISGLPIIAISPYFVSKYSFELLKFDTEEEHSCFIYQDNTQFEQSIDNKYVVNLIYNQENPGGLYYIRNDYIRPKAETAFNLPYGLKSLIQSEKKVTNYVTNSVRCYSCGEFIFEDEATFINGYFYCEDCFSNEFFVCDGCGEIFSRDAIYTTDYEAYCELCYDEYKKEVV